MPLVSSGLAATLGGCRDAVNDDKRGWKTMDFIQQRQKAVPPVPGSSSSAGPVPMWCGLGGKRESVVQHTSCEPQGPWRCADPQASTSVTSGNRPWFDWL